MKIIILMISVYIGYLIYNKLYKHKQKEAKDIAQQIFKNGQEKADYIQKRISENIVNEIAGKKESFNQIFEELEENNLNLEKKNILQKKDFEYIQYKLKELNEEITAKTQDIKLKEVQNTEFALKLESLMKQTYQILLSYSNYTPSEIKTKFLKDYSNIIEAEVFHYYDSKLENLANNSQHKACRIISTVLSRCDFNHWFENKLSNLHVENEVFKENFEKIQECLEKELETKNLEIVYDDSAQMANIVLADSLKREICRQVLLKLIATNTFEPEKISAIIRDTKNCIENEVLETGQKATKLLNIDSSDEICKLLGKLKYRSSFSQNVLGHSIEVSILARMLAYEIGLNADIACKSGLLHDIGKAIDHEQEGGHPEIGGQILEKIGELPEVIEGVVGHHDNVKASSLYATLINAVDAISASRPGARRESFEKYINRLEKLESIANGIFGIENVFAISAGRELRIIVNPNKIDDETTNKIAVDISKTIEKELNYPGKIKVTVIREMKFVEYAR